MSRRQILAVAVALSIAPASPLAAQDKRGPSAAFLAHYEAPFQRAYRVDGVERKAAVFAPKAARETPAPLILAFHGKGGDMKTAAEAMLYQKHWKEAIVVYPQGLNTPGGPDPEGTLSGWDHRPDGSNRDIRFVDVLVRSLAKDYKLDNRRVYVTGQSNGGFFAYTLWAARGDKIAAVAPCAALTEIDVATLKPKPVLQVAGEADPYVAFAEQEKLTERLRELNGCGAGRPWLSGGREYRSDAGTPVVTLFHKGGHGMPEGAAELIAKFFREHSLPGQGEATPQ